MSLRVATPTRSQADRAQHRGDQFAAVMTAIVRRLPFGLSKIVAPTFLGFAIVNGATFGVDMGLLTAMHGLLHWPLALSITLSYSAAFGISFVLNRALNFRSHTAVGPQLAIYLVVVVINYLIWILGIGAGLAALGVEYHLARTIAGLCEAAYMYAAMRWLVFRPSTRGESR
jgi:putative flippase GtrA